MDILDLEFFVEVQYGIFKILNHKNICKSTPFEYYLEKIVFNVTSDH